MAAPVIVSYQRLRDAFSSNLESAAGFSSLESAESDLSQVEMVAELSRALKALESEEGPPGVMISARDQAASLLQTFLARQSLKSEKVEPLPTGGLEAKFDNHDILGWAGSFFRWWKRIRPHEFVDWDGTIDRLPNRARIAILSDWGSGLYGAPECSKSIQREAAGFDLVLHLGDIYYAGDDDEVRDRFIAFWPELPGALNRTLNGNHEMYTGGKAYFKIALARFGQRSSFCALENDHYVLVGLDTAYQDHRLHGKQVQWLRQLVKKAEGRRVILFSHHQPYSVVKELNRTGAGTAAGLLRDLSEFLQKRQIFAWYWGHEHHCIIYDDHPFFGLKGRCVGHSGFPEFRSKLDILGDIPAKPSFLHVSERNLIPGGFVLDGPNRHIVGHEKRYVPHGYVVLDLDGERLTESYREAGGELLKQVEVR